MNSSQRFCAVSVLKLGVFSLAWTVISSSPVAAQSGGQLKTLTVGRGGERPIPVVGATWSCDDPDLKRLEKKIDRVFYGEGLGSYEKGNVLIKYHEPIKKARLDALGLELARIYTEYSPVFVPEDSDVEDVSSAELLKHFAGMESIFEEETSTFSLTHQGSLQSRYLQSWLRSSADQQLQSTSSNSQRRSIRILPRLARDSGSEESQAVDPEALQKVFSKPVPVGAAKLKYSGTGYDDLRKAAMKSDRQAVVFGLRDSELPGYKLLKVDGADAETVYRRRSTNHLLGNQVYVYRPVSDPKTSREGESAQVLAAIEKAYQKSEGSEKARRKSVRSSRESRWCGESSRPPDKNKRQARPPGRVSRVSPRVASGARWNLDGGTPF